MVGTEPNRTNLGGKGFSASPFVCLSGNPTIPVRGGAGVGLGPGGLYQSPSARVQCARSESDLTRDCVASERANHRAKRLLTQL